MEMDTSDEYLESKLSIKTEIKQENDVLPNTPQETDETDSCVRDEPWQVDLNKVKCELETFDDENGSNYLVTDGELKSLTSVKTEGLGGKSDDNNGPEQERQMKKRGPPRGPEKACQFCGKTFRDSHKLKKHVMDHTGERPFKCELCSSAFKEKYNLSVHIKTHTEFATINKASTSSTKAKRKCFSIEEKKAIVWRLEDGQSNSKLAVEFGVSRSTISTIWSNKDKIIRAFNANELKAKKLRGSQHDDLDKVLIEWYKENQSDNVWISGPILRQKANEFSLLLGKENFQCSESWISRFKVRHNIVFGKGNVEPADVAIRLAKTWSGIMYKEMRKGYKDEEIFNAHEFGLFYRATSDEATKFKDGKCIHGELSKERITVLAATNLTGSQKRDLLVIGNVKNPTFFNNVTHLPVTYENNSRAWMTADTFVTFLRKWDDELSRSSKRILLIVDNSPAHPNIDDLKAIKLAFLPTNCTSALRPFDQGIVRSLKTNYRRLQVRETIQNIELNNDCKLMILDAIFMISQAWDTVTSATIRNGFKSAGFVAIDQTYDETTEESDEDNIPLSQWVKVSQNTDFSKCDDLEEFVNVDNDLATCGDVGNNTVGVGVTENNDESDDMEDADSDIKVPTCAEALQAICTIKKFVMLGGINDSLLNENIVTIERKIEHLYYQLKCREQSKITDSFLS